MQQKILTFIVNNKKFLALYSEPHPEHGKGGWFVVTGGLEKNESHEDAVIREVKEETGLVVTDIFALNCGSIYNWNDDICYEKNFISFVQGNNIILNEEHSKYTWLELNEFISILDWSDDKALLRKILIKALDKEKFFTDFHYKDYR